MTSETATTATLNFCGDSVLQVKWFQLIDAFGSVHSVKWQRVEQVVNPVTRRVVDVRVLTKILTKRRRVEGVVDVEVGRIIQGHQNDQTFLPLQNDIVVQRNVELLQTVSAVNTLSVCG